MDTENLKISIPAAILTQAKALAESRGQTLEELVLSIIQEEL